MMTKTNILLDRVLAANCASRVYFSS